MTIRTFRLAILVGATLAASAAAAEDFTLLTYETPAQFSARTDPAKAAAYWAAWSGVGEAMARAGVLKGGSALRPADGPRAEKTDLSGYFVISVIDRQTALSWAERLRKAGAAAVDVRSNLPNPTMP